jgi:hypothetical protein
MLLLRVKVFGPPGSDQAFPNASPVSATYVGGRMWPLTVVRPAGKLARGSSAIVRTV